MKAIPSWAWTQKGGGSPGPSPRRSQVANGTAQKSNDPSTASEIKAGMDQ